MAIIGGSNFKAGGTITQYACLKLHTDFASLVVTTANTEEVIAVATNDANTSQPAALQYKTLVPGEVYTLKNTGGITAGDYLTPEGSAGDVKTAASGDRYYFIALETKTTGLYGKAICVLSSHLLA